MYSAGFHLEPAKDIPKDAQEEAAGISLELQQEELKEAQSLAKTVQRLSTEYRNKLHAIIGPQYLAPYLEYRVPLRQRIREVIAKAPPTVEGEREIREARLQAVEDSRKFLKEIGFDMARAAQLREEYQTRIHEVVDKALGRPKEPNYLVLPEMAPKDIHNPYIVYRPPYPGWAWALSWNKSDGAGHRAAHLLNSVSGELGTYTLTHLSEAGDDDWAHVLYRTAMRFWYRLPVAGMVEVWMNMQCIDTPYSGWLSDEYGFSDSACDQKSTAYLRVITPAPEASRWSAILDYHQTGTDANWSGHVVAPGVSRWAHIFSANAYAGGTTLLLEVGTEEWNHFWSNDVSIDSYMVMHWFLRRVLVRSTGE